MAVDTKTSNLGIELENIVEREPKLSKNGNWGSEMVGGSGKYNLYSIMFNNRFKSTQVILIKEYENGRYSVLMDKQYEPKTIGDVSDLISGFLVKYT